MMIWVNEEHEISGRLREKDAAPERTFCGSKTRENSARPVNASEPEYLDVTVSGVSSQTPRERSFVVRVGQAAISNQDQ
jgi:hypothetical protein